MENLDLVFSPQIPLWISVALTCLIMAFCLVGLFLKMRGSLVRLLAGALVSAALFNPAIVEEKRKPLNTIVPLIIDETTSQKLADRESQTKQAVAELRARFSKLEGFELREVTSRDAVSKASDVSSSIFASLALALQDVPIDQLGGAIFVTDGQVHDVPSDPEAIGLSGPLHVLLTGREGERDRRIVLKNAPRFGVVGESQEIRYEVRESGFGRSGGRVRVTITIDGEVQSVEEVTVGEESSYVFDMPHGGKNIVELNVETAEDEITEVNNHTFVAVNGIRKNLRVLLVSGEPHSGERTWRNLLKSDASVDLIHFTILRPPEKQDGTPINELSLIAFPTRELFVQKIHEFDLIIFDRYKRRGVLPLLYFDNIARYVEEGGAVLIAAGPEFGEPTSIAATPLEKILPAIADGNVYEGPYRPQISELGEKHPVTRKLDGWDPEKPDWSRWFRSVGVQQESGDPIMTDENGSSILLLQHVNEGRVALLLSDHVWLWARGFEGGGPHVQLLRRMAHWLMKEPELDEERLIAEAKGNILTITRQTLGSKPPDVELEWPSGTTRKLEFVEQDNGLWAAVTESEEIGLYRAKSGDFRALAQVGPTNPREFANVFSTDEPLQTVVQATSGSVTRISESGVPRVVGVSRNATAYGRGWIGVVNANASSLEGVSRIPLYNGLIGLSLLVLAMGFMWLREGR